MGAEKNDQAGELALSAGGGLERASIHPAHLAEGLLQAEHHLERALRQGVGRHRVEAQKAGDARGPLVDLRVVLHGAGPERVHARVDGEVLLAELHVVAHGLGLRDLGQAGLLLAEQVAIEGGRIHLRDLGLGQRSARDRGQGQGRQADEWRAPAR